MDTLSQGKSILHQLDPTILLITTLFFLSTIVSFDKYSISALIPFFLYPTFLLFVGEMPFDYFAKKVIWVSPFILFFAFINPFFDREAIIQFEGIHISAGIISSLSLILRFILTVSSGLILIGLIGIQGVCLGLEKLYLPKVFVTQLLLLYRYLFILTEELSKMILAKSLRQFDSRTMKFKNYISILGHLFLRSLDRAERIYLSMCSRGFTGHIYLARRQTINGRDLCFLLIWITFFLIFRFFNIPLFIGTFFTGRS